MTPIKDIDGVTHWASYDVVDGRFRRVAVYRVVGVDEYQVYHFETMRGNVRLRRHFRFLFLSTFRPVAINGRKR